MKNLVTRKHFAPLVFALGLILGIGATGTAWAVQTHMQNALHDLYSAQSELNAAVADKGGHRNQALSLVGQAIGQVKMGVRYANRR